MAPLLPRSGPQCVIAVSNLINTVSSGILTDNGLSVAFGLLFLVTLAGQAVAGHADYNHQEILDGGQPIGFLAYLATSDFAVTVAENWQSEYLQFFLYVFATVWLVQRGSPESKLPGQVGKESDEKQKVGAHTTADSPTWARAGGWRTALFSRSLGLVMGALFLLSWLAQSIAGQSAYNEEQLSQLTYSVSWFGYLGSADFWTAPCRTAVRVPRHRIHGRAQRLPTPTRITGVQARRHATRRHRSLRLTSDEWAGDVSAATLSLRCGKITGDLRGPVMAASVACSRSAEA